MSETVDTTPEQLAALAARPADTPILVVNLLQFRKPNGLQHYLQYGQDTAPHLARVGAKVRSGGGDPSFIIGDGERPWWDAIVVVEYPSARAFLDMVSNSEYARLNEDRIAALERAELIATSVWSADT